MLEEGELSAADIVRKIVASTIYPNGITREDVLKHVDWNALAAADWQDGIGRSETYSRVHRAAVEKAIAATQI